MPPQSCCRRKTATTNQSQIAIAYQNFPVNKLGAAIPPDALDATVYTYVIASVHKDPTTGFKHEGSGPNWEGGFITLCTCKHAMRSYRSAAEWTEKPYWIAGFTGSTAEFGGCNWLVYLMKVGESYESQYDLVEAFRKKLRASALNAKFAHSNNRGDVFEPKTSALTGMQKFVPSNYRRPVEDHSHAPDEWHRDIDYTWRSIRRPALLVGDPSHSYLWTRPTLRVPTSEKVPRGNPKRSIGWLLEHLQS
jgi:hypothetical protein